jgi:hypothetical protein
VSAAASPPSAEPLLEVHLDGSGRESRTDLRPALPLVIVRGGPTR